MLSIVKYLTLYISLRRDTAVFRPRSSGEMTSPSSAGIDELSALNKTPLVDSATRDKPNPGDLFKKSKRKFKTVPYRIHATSHHR